RHENIPIWEYWRQLLLQWRFQEIVSFIILYVLFRGLLAWLESPFHDTRLAGNQDARESMIAV
ncbi:MAG: hypothetical protein ACI9H8_001466, partial [Lysobacterales bacterium]